jgi:hypothetical protein
MNWFSISNSIPNFVYYKQRMCSSDNFMWKKNPHWNNYDLWSHPWNSLRKYMHLIQSLQTRTLIALLQRSWNISQFANISLFVSKLNNTKNERKKTAHPYTNHSKFIFLYKFMEAMEPCYYMIKLLYYIQVNT